MTKPDKTHSLRVAYTDGLPITVCVRCGATVETASWAEPCANRASMEQIDNELRRLSGATGKRPGCD